MWVINVGNKMILVGNKTNNVGNKTDFNELSSRDKIFSVISNNTHITKNEIMLLLGLSKTTIDRNIADLKKTGKIERKGSKKTGYWVINN